MVRKSITSLLFLSGVFISATSMAQPQPDLTPEQQFELLKLLLTNQGKAAPQQNAPAVAIAAIKTEEEIAAIFGQWKQLDKGVVFERFRDGFSINGKRHIDPEGAIIAYGFDAQTGDFTYLSDSGLGQYLIKSGRAFNDAEPVTIGTAERRGAMWTVNTATGKKFSGYRLIPLARGFVVARDNTGFRYIPGKGTTNIVASEQFAIAALQNGDVSSTGYLLLERIPSPDNSAKYGAVGELFSAVKALGSTLGVGKKEDYALLNIDTQQVVPINVSLEDKQVQFMSACRQRNYVFAECARMDSFESLFQPNGMKNMTHYFWRITWLNAQGRPILISQEGGLSKITATDLTSGRKVVLFDRTMGISEFSVAQKTDGKISVSAQLGFTSETKDDVSALIDTLPDTTSKQETPQARSDRRVITDIQANSADSR